MVRQRESLRGCTRRNVSPLPMPLLMPLLLPAIVATQPNKNHPAAAWFMAKFMAQFMFRTMARLMRVVMGKSTALLQPWQGRCPRPTRPCGPTLA